MTKLKLIEHYIPTIDAFSKSMKEFVESFYSSAPPLVSRDVLIKLNDEIQGKIVLDTFITSYACSKKLTEQLR